MKTDPTLRVQPHSPDEVLALDTAAAARALGVSKVHLENLRKQGGGPPWFTLGERAVRYPKRALVRWLDRQALSSNNRPAGQGGHDAAA